ncbi:MAG: hypothetical protein ACI9VT_000802 [Psychroserpens sp.]|jgi:hypothetical protein
MKSFVIPLCIVLAISVFVLACGDSSKTGSSGPAMRSYSVSVDSLADPNNFYPYLMDPVGNCMVPQSIQNSCHTSTTNAVTQLKYGPGFIGSSFGLPSKIIESINIDPLVQEELSVYSGATATYTAKHAPVAVENGQYTYFVFSGPVQLDDKVTVVTTSGGGNTSTSAAFLRKSDSKSNALGIYLARFNHITSRVSAPLLIHVKHTDDPHDNAVLNFDDMGNLFILISGRSLNRSALLYFIELPSQQRIFNSDVISLKNISPDNIDYSTIRGTEITYPDIAGITYPKLLRVSGGFRLIYTAYCLKGEKPSCDLSRQLWSARLKYDDAISDKAILDQIQPLAAFGGHYAMAASTPDGQYIAVVFNLLEEGSPSNRTNLYALFSNDQGQSWRSITDTSGSGVSVDDLLPLNSEDELDKVVVFKPLKRSGRTQQRIYLKDISLTNKNGLFELKVLYVAGVGNDSHSPTLNNSHYLGYAYLGDSQWHNQTLTREIDHNYSTGFIYNGADDLTRVYFPATPENNNNGLAGGAAAYLDVKTVNQNLTYITRLKQVNSPEYLSKLCEINFLRAVANSSFDGFVGIGGAANPYQFMSDSANQDLPASPLFIFDDKANIYRLPMSLVALDENQEMPLSQVDKNSLLQCDSGA